MGIFETAAFILRHPMSRRRPVQSIADWVKWQIGSRILPGAVVVPWIGGTRLVVAPGMAGATGNIYVGLHEFEEMAFALHLLRPGDLMLDVGANVGSYTVLAAGAVGATVHAFEPVAKASAHLSDNLRVNGLEGRVTLHRAAVGAAPGELAMEIDRDSCNRVLQPGEVSAHATTMVPVITLDATLPEQHPALVKIDVEGFEAAVLAGAKAFLGNTQALISEVSRDAEAVFRAIRRRRPASRPLRAARAQAHTAGCAGLQRARQYAVGARPRVGLRAPALGAALRREGAIALSGRCFRRAHGAASGSACSCTSAPTGAVMLPASAEPAVGSAQPAAVTARATRP